jgi:hypothetical protein
MKKAVLALATAATIGVTALVAPSPAQAWRGGWGPGLALVTATMADRVTATMAAMAPLITAGTPIMAAMLPPLITAGTPQRTMTTDTPPHITIAGIVIAGDR